MNKIGKVATKREVEAHALRARIEKLRESGKHCRCAILDYPLWQQLVRILNHGLLYDSGTKVRIVRLSYEGVPITWDAAIKRDGWLIIEA